MVEDVRARAFERVVRGESEVFVNQRGWILDGVYLDLGGDYPTLVGPKDDRLDEGRSYNQAGRIGTARGGSCRGQA